MNDERWQDIVGMVKDKFDIDSQTTEELSEEDGPGSIEILEFDGPLGKMRLTRTTKLLVLGKKVLGSRRIGSESSVQYTYSDTEVVNKFTAYKFNEATGEWDELAMDRGEMVF